MNPDSRYPIVNLSKADIDAIICALPLVSLIDVVSPTQAQYNDRLCASACSKLLNHTSDITIEELRVICTAVSFALDFLSGHAEEYRSEIEPEWKTELSQHFFVFNRLFPQLSAHLPHTGF